MQELIKKTSWVWYWSGNWPLLDNFQMIDSLFENEFEKITGIRPTKKICFLINSILTIYHSQEKYDYLKNYFLKKYKENPNFMKNYYQQYAKKVSEDIQALIKINELNLKEKNNRDLINLLNLKRKHSVYNSVIDFIAWYMEFFFIPVLQDFVLNLAH